MSRKDSGKKKKGYDCQTISACLYKTWGKKGKGQDSGRPRCHLKKKSRDREARTEVDRENSNQGVQRARYLVLLEFVMEGEKDQGGRNTKESPSSALPRGDFTRKKRQERGRDGKVVVRKCT